MAMIASGDESGEAGSVPVVGVTASMGVSMDVAAPAITEGLAVDTSLSGPDIEGDTIPIVG